jgi:hypothetical protein
MGKVVFNMTISLDGFVAGPNDGPDNGLGDGGDALFNWYFSGDTEVPISDGNMVLKVSQQSAEILNAAFETYGAGCGDAKPLISPGPGAAIPRAHPVSSSPIPSHRNGSTKDRRSPLSPMGLKAPFVRQNRPPAIRMSSSAPPISCSSVSTPA